MIKNPQNGHVRKILVQSASHRPVRKIDTAVNRYAYVNLYKAACTPGENCMRARKETRGQIIINQCSYI